MAPLSITPNALILSEPPNTRIPCSLRMQNIVHALVTVVLHRCRGSLREPEARPKTFVYPRYLALEVAFDGLVFRVNGRLLLTKTSDAECWCFDLADVNRDDVPRVDVVAGDAVDGVTRFDEVDFLDVIAL